MKEGIECFRLINACYVGSQVLNNGIKEFFFFKIILSKIKKKKKKGYTILVLIEVELDDFNHYFGQTHFHKWYFIKLGARPNDWIRNNWSRDLLYT